MIVYIGCDHAGFELKQKVVNSFPEIQWQDQGTFNGDSVDYPDYADLVCRNVTKAEIENKKNNIFDSLQGKVLGVLICGSGQGMAIRANKYPQIRAALCWNEESTRLAREHNNANVISLSARSTETDRAIAMLKIFFSTHFEGGRHQKRVQKLSGDTGC